MYTTSNETFMLLASIVALAQRMLKYIYERFSSDLYRESTHSQGHPTIVLDSSISAVHPSR